DGVYIHTVEHWVARRRQDTRTPWGPSLLVIGTSCLAARSATVESCESIELSRWAARDHRTSQISCLSPSAAPLPARRTRPSAS
ncbi:uncharacterized protein P884DRAFT_327768, partial [Thermothelomyces heterothallicus CBS 202.75]|uniref:uncharacterized protein n=1 Tax=Thermothelomyces heterothallicus CBS 202.75 TaxID=1149848 RepID=UPI003742E6C5